MNSTSIDGLPAITIAHESNRGPLNPMLGTFPRIKPTPATEKLDTPGNLVGVMMQIADVRLLVGVVLGLLLSAIYSRVGAAFVGYQMAA